MSQPTYYRTVWGGLKTGDIVKHDGGQAKVIAFPADAVPAGCVPIISAAGCIMKVPRDDLERISPAPPPRNRTRRITLDLLVFLVVIAVVVTILAQRR